MQKVAKYTIFNTKWGHFGFAAEGSFLCRTYLPAAEPEKIKTAFLKNIQNLKYDKSLFKGLQQQIAAYFDGDIVDFSTDIPLSLGSFSPFGASVLAACRKIRFSQVVTYSQLARKAGSAGAARAVGSVMAKNPMPLIIPCHRVIRTDGALGGFSAPGGLNLKKRLLSHEKH